MSIEIDAPAYSQARLAPRGVEDQARTRDVACHPIKHPLMTTWLGLPPGLEASIVVIILPR